MPSSLFETRKRYQGKEPVLIALYSLIPGIGQLYNGKTKKGILFLAAAFLSFLMLLASFNPSSTLAFAFIFLAIVKFLFGFIYKFEFEPSPAADFLMNTIKFGGSFSNFLLFTIFCFVIYSMIDAYLDAEKVLEKRRLEYKFISTDSTAFRFSESTAGSYIIHALVFSLFFLTSLFLVIPSRDREQITEIEFIMPQIESKKPPPPKTMRRSTVQSIDQGKHDPSKEVSPPSPSRPASPPPRPVPKAVEQMAALPPRPVTPQPKAAPRPVPKIAEVPALNPAKFQPAPVSPSENITELPQPSNVPQPSSPARAPTATTSVAVIPRVPGLGGTGGLGNAGNPPPNSNLNAPPSIAAKKDIDFGPYMEELQRRIKREWRPPRGNESKRVVVVFKIGTRGALSDLQVKVSSGLSDADKAALLAVQNAAPFSGLPHGAPSSVDIEFTFDYNVFGGN